MLTALVLASVVLIAADRDATIFEESDGLLANGAGPTVFSGRNNLSADGIRRGLIRFDLTGVAIPTATRPLILESVELVLTNLTASNVDPREFRLHRVLADWTEGPAYSQGGFGVPPLPGDVTWLHRSYPSQFWMHAGSQFDGEPSARLVVSGPGVYRFSGDGLSRDLAYWLQHPDQNFGWILIGDETTRQNARAFGSRENPNPDYQPVLELRYREAVRFKTTLR
jgi:hypothetical protein